MTSITIGERMAVLETKVNSIETTVNKIDKKFDKLTDDLPRTYATKIELNNVKIALLEKDAAQDRINNSKWGWLSKNWFQILQMIALIVVGIIASKGGI